MLNTVASGSWFTVPEIRPDDSTCRKRSAVSCLRSQSREGPRVIFLRVVRKQEEDGVRQGIIVAMGALALLIGCGDAGNKAAGVPVEPKWKGEPYRLAFDTKAGTPNASGISLPAIKFTGNPDALETRALLVMRFNAPATSADQEPVMHRMIGAPMDIHGEEGTVPADYMGRVDTGLGDYLSAYCVQGKVTVSVALARSSLNPQGSDADVDAKRLSDWVPIDVVYKKHNPKCKP